MTLTTKCHLCGDGIIKKREFVEEEITYWENDDTGKSFTYLYHPTCFGVSRR